MKMHYYPDTDSLYIDLRDKPSSESREIGDGLVVDLHEHGAVVGMDIDQASKKLDLPTLDLEDLPLRVVKMA